MPCTAWPGLAWPGLPAPAPILSLLPLHESHHLLRVLSRFWASACKLPLPGVPSCSSLPGEKPFLQGPARKPLRQASPPGVSPSPCREQGCSSRKLLSNPSPADRCWAPRQGPPRGWGPGGRVADSGPGPGPGRWAVGSRTERAPGGGQGLCLVSPEKASWRRRPLPNRL